jgi:hypothetical protein
MKVFGKIILILMLATIIVPIGYLAWRAGQPMELPQFNGLTYYQYMSWRKAALHQIAVEYQAAHPNAKMGGCLDMCFQDEAGITLGISFPLAGFYTLAGIYPDLQQHIQKSALQYVPKDVTWLTFLPSVANIREVCLEFSRACPSYRIRNAYKISA